MHLHCVKLISSHHCVTSCIESLEKEPQDENENIPVTDGLTGADWPEKIAAWMPVNTQLVNSKHVLKKTKNKEVTCECDLLFCHLKATSVCLWNKRLKYPCSGCTCIHSLLLSLLLLSTVKSLYHSQRQEISVCPITLRSKWYRSQNKWNCRGLKKMTVTLALIIFSGWGLSGVAVLIPLV